MTEVNTTDLYGLMAKSQQTVATIAKTLLCGMIDAPLEQQVSHDNVTKVLGKMQHRTSVTAEVFSAPTAAPLGYASYNYQRLAINAAFRRHDKPYVQFGNNPRRRVRLGRPETWIGVQVSRGAEPNQLAISDQGHEWAGQLDVAAWGKLLSQRAEGEKNTPDQLLAVADRFQASVANAHIVALTYDKVFGISNNRQPLEALLSDWDVVALANTPAKR